MRNDICMSERSIDKEKKISHYKIQITAVEIRISNFTFFINTTGSLQFCFFFFLFLVVPYFFSFIFNVITTIAFEGKLSQSAL